jgi:hypothetical protein
MKTKQSQAFGSFLTKSLEESPIKELTSVEVGKGGPGSGHYGHAGRPGQVGGSGEGGVAVGRGEAEDADAHFKWSGKGALTRKKGSAEVSIAPKATGRFEVHGVADDKGKLKKGRATLRVGGKSVEIDHDELHALRSKMRYLQMANDRDVTHIAGKKIVRGQGVEVKVGGKSVIIPVNKDTVKAIDRAAGHARDHGLSFTKEHRGQIREVVHAMKTEHPVEALKNRKFSKAGQLAAFMSHVDRHTTKDLSKILRVAQAGKNKMGKAAIAKIHEEMVAQRNAGRKAREKFGGTQAMKGYKRAAVLLHKLMNPKR